MLLLPTARTRRSGRHMVFLSGALFAVALAIPLVAQLRLRRLRQRWAARERIARTQKRMLAAFVFCLAAALAIFAAAPHAAAQHHQQGATVRTVIAGYVVFPGILLIAMVGGVAFASRRRKRHPEQAGDVLTCDQPAPVVLARLREVLQAYPRAVVAAEADSALSATIPGSWSDVARVVRARVDRPGADLGECTVRITAEGRAYPSKRSFANTYLVHEVVEQLRSSLDHSSTPSALSNLEIGADPPNGDTTSVVWWLLASVLKDPDATASIRASAKRGQAALLDGNRSNGADAADQVLAHLRSLSPENGMRALAQKSGVASAVRALRSAEQAMGA